MKVIPSNQTLILANERGLSGGLPATASVRARYSAGGDAVLQRVTLVAGRPDDTFVYLQADYSSSPSLVQLEPSLRAEATGNAVASAPGKAVASPLTSLPARTAPQGASSAPYGSSRGIALYASTQRPPAEAPVAQIDVHA